MARKETYLPDNYIKYMQQTGVATNYFKVVGRDCVYLELIIKDEPTEVLTPMSNDKVEGETSIPDSNASNYTQVPLRSAEEIIAAHFSKGKVILSDTPRTQFVPVKDEQGNVVSSRVEVVNNYNRHPMKAIIVQENPNVKYIGSNSEFNIIVPPQKNFVYRLGDLIEFIQDKTVYIYTIQLPPETYKNVYWQLSLKFVKHRTLFEE